MPFASSSSIQNSCLLLFMVIYNTFNSFDISVHENGEYKYCSCCFVMINLGLPGFNEYSILVIDLSNGMKCYQHECKLNFMENTVLCLCDQPIQVTL